MKEIGISVIGVNMAGRLYHLPNLMEFSDVDVSICDINPEKLNQAGDDNNISAGKRYLDYQEMLKQEKPDAVIVSIAQYPNKLSPVPKGYFKVVNDILDRKIPVMVEKPLAMTPAAARPLAEKAEKAGIITMVNVNRRFNPLLNFCLESVRERGPVITANCHFYKGKKIGVNDTCDWLTADMIHALDLLRYINTDSEIISFNGAYNRLSPDSQPSGFYALAEFDSGSTGIFSSNVRAGARKEIWQIHGLGISVYIETEIEEGGRLMKARIYKDDNFNSPREYWDYTVTGSDVWQRNRGFYYSDRYFVDCVKQNIMPRCNFTDALKTVEYCHKVLNGRENIINIGNNKNIA